MQKKKVVEKRMTLPQLKSYAKEHDPLWKTLEKSEDNRILCLINLTNKVYDLEELVQKQAEVIVRMGSYNPEKMQEANC